MTESRLKGIKAVYFDAVGTLLLPAQSVTLTYQRLAKRFGADIPEEELRRRIWSEFEVQERLDYAAGWTTSEERENERWHTIVTLSLKEVSAPEAAFAELWAYYSMPIAWKPHPETATVLPMLAERGLILGMASNFDARLGPVVAGFSEFVPLKERLIISSLIGVRKPAKGFFERVVEQAGCAPGEILFIGDDLRNDYQGAEAAGLRALQLDLTGEGQAPQRVRSLMSLLEGEDI